MIGSEEKTVIRSSGVDLRLSRQQAWVHGLRGPQRPVVVIEVQIAPNCQQR
jgi:hypothetical protein